MVSEQGQTKIAKETQIPRRIVSQNLQEGGSWQNKSSNLIFPVAGLCKIHKEKWNSFGFPMAQWVKNLSAMQGTQDMWWVEFLGWEDPLEEKMATNYSILA